MNLKHYTAATLQEAMLKVKNDLGRDAVILHTRRCKQGGIFGFFGKDFFEVTATLEAKIAPVVVHAKSEADHSAQNNRFSALEAEVSQLRQAMENALRPQPTPMTDQVFSQLKDLLERNDVDRHIADKLIQDVAGKFSKDQDKAAVRLLLQKRLCQCLSRVEGIKLLSGRPKIVALLGPTGVGKTTTIAKLAANFTLVEEKKVVLITADTYRIAAVEQLKTYGEIIGVPVDVVFTREELHAALARHADKDLILLDTAGSSPRNAKQVQELEDLFRDLPDLERHIVVSATTKPRDAMEIVARFASREGPCKLIFTKVDESETLGVIVNIMCNSRAVLSYVANGQSVPDDIELANPEKLAGLILREQSYA